MNDNAVSKALSYLLRHCKDPVYVDPDGGWAPVETILQVLGQDYPGVTRADLDRIVREDKKTRYSYGGLDGQLIRANQGHSIPGVVISMEEPTPPPLLYHGTADRFVESILREGLRPMSRLWVHISPDYETAVKVGSRHGRPVVLAFRAQDFVRDGYRLYRSANGVWQAAAVPPEYLSVL